MRGRRAGIVRRRADSPEQTHPTRPHQYHSDDSLRPHYKILPTSSDKIPVPVAADHKHRTARD